MSIKYEFFGHEVESLVGKAAVAIVAAVTSALYLTALAVTVPVHFALRALGREGFVKRESSWDGSYSVLYAPSREGFRKLR